MDFFSLVQVEEVGIRRADPGRRESGEAGRLEPVPLSTRAILPPVYP